MARVNYLNNKDILLEIHKSKCSYSYFTEKKYNKFNKIVDDLSEINEDMILECKEAAAKSLMSEERQRQKDAGIKINKIKVDEILPESIPTEDIVFRCVTYDHIPDHEGRVKTPKKTSDYKVRLFFHPFKHYIIKDDQFVEVGRSHWKGDFVTGHFCQDHGKTTNKLGNMYMELTKRFAKKGNWRGYTYRDEMESRAIEQLSAVGLLFNEAKSDNPFAYYTVCCTTAFTSILNQEKKNQKLRDDMIEMAGATPSMTRQIENEFDQRMIEYYSEKGIEPPKPINTPKVGFGKSIKNNLTRLPSATKKIGPLPN